MGFLLLGTLSACAVFAGAGFRQPRDVPPEPAAAQVERLFAEWNRPDSPGCSVGVSRNRVPVLERGYGMASLESGLPITPASVFHVASVSKQFTAMSILLLAERGRLSLDDDVRKHVPGWADRESRLTIRHLLTHTGGLRDVFLLRELAPPRAGRGDLNDELVALLARQRALNFAPGTEFQYSNGGYLLLADIVKRASGQSLRAFAQANIFEPLGMTATHVRDDPRMVVPPRATGYHRDARALQPAPHADLGRLVGTTGLHTTARDLLRWLDNFSSARVGDPALLAAMQAPAVLEGGEKTAYGFGLEIGQHRGIRTISHGGGDPGYAAYVLRFSDRGLSVAVLCNLDNIGSRIGELARGVADVYLTDLPAPSSPDAVAPPPRVSLAAAELANKAGLYRDLANDTYGRIFVQGGALRARDNPAQDGEGIELTPISPSRFVVAATPIEVEFLPAAADRPQQVRVLGAGPKPTLMERVPAFVPSAADRRALVGPYRSDELEVTYTVVARGTALAVQRPGRPEVRLQPLARDTFYGALVEVVTFARDAGGPTSFTLRTSGVRRLRFDRRSDRRRATP